jgi:hypothetical protein
MGFFRLFGLGLVALLMFSGCGSNNSDSPISDTNTSEIVPPIGSITDPAVTVVLPTSSTVLTTNSQVVTIDVRVFDSANNPYSEGTVNLINSPDVINGRDVGTFDKYKSTLKNGIATFTYTAPADLKKDTSNIYFGFYHSSDATKVKQYTMSIVPELNQTIVSTYELRSSNADDVKMSLNSIKSISYSVYDSNNAKVADSQIKSITVTTLNPSLGLLSDSAGSDNNEKLSQVNKNSITVNVHSNTISGLIPLKVAARFIDANGDEQNLTKVYSIVVLSGPPTAFSLSYAGTSQDDSKAKFIEQWVLTATDKYNNLINTNPTISTGMIAGYAQSSTATPLNAGNYLYSIPPKGGSIAQATPDEFHASEDIFANVDFDHDYLVTFGNGYTYDASGKWNIAPNSNSVVNLSEAYYGKDVSDLGFAVGNNYRQDTCRFGEEWVGNIHPKGNNYILDSNGSVILDVEYDYYLVGKDVMLWVNLTGSVNNEITRVGEAKKVTLRGRGLLGDSYSFSKGFEGVIRLYVFIDHTSEIHYRNANFGGHVEVSSSDTNWTIAGSSMSDGNITDCTLSGGVAYVDVNITDPAGSAGSVVLKRVKVANEF